VNRSQARAEPAPATRRGAAPLRRRIIKGSAWVFAGRVAASASGLLIASSLAHILKHGELGAYFLIFNLVLIGSSVGQIGLDRAVVRFVASSMATGDAGRARRAVRNTMLLGLAGSLVTSAVLVLGGGSLLAHDVFHSSLLAGVIVLTAAWLLTSALQGLLAETLRGFQSFGLATLFNGLLVNGFALVVFGGAWLLGAHPTFGWVIATTVLITSGACVVAGVIVYRRVRDMPPDGTAPPREILSVSWPLWVTTIGTFAVGTGVDLWVVGAFGNLSDVAVYGAASRLSLLLATPFLIVSQVIPPIIAQLHAQGRRHMLERAVRSVSTVATIPAALVMGVFAVAGGPIMGLAFGSYYSRGASVLAILSVSKVVAVATGSSGTALMMTGNQRTMMNITLCTACLSVGGELALVQPFGMVGVAVATSTAQVLQNLLQLLYAKRRLGIWTHAKFSLQPLRSAYSVTARR
jgi:O-antigen/teichoic acid export membrane protein